MADGGGRRPSQDGAGGFAAAPKMAAREKPAAAAAAATSEPSERQEEMRSSLRRKRSVTPEPAARKPCGAGGPAKRRPGRASPLSGGGLPATMAGCGGEGATVEGSEELSNSMNLMDFSDEILLHILRYIPVSDLVLNIRGVCRKLAALSLDKSLTHLVNLHKDYQVDKDKVKQLMRAIGKEIQELNMAGCYWLPSSTVDQVIHCKNLVRLNLSGCHLTSLRLSKMLSPLQRLRSLTIDVNPGFDASHLSSECKATLSHVLELKQTLYTPSYGVVPCCTSLEKLLLYFEILDGSRVILSGQLMVGESNVPHYQNLRVFYARLAPGRVNEDVVRLYLAVLSDRTPEKLHAFLISAPGGFAESFTVKNLLDSMARNVTLDALQLPRSWMNGSSLLQHLKFSNPVYFSFSRCSLSGGQLIQRVLNGGKDLRSLVGLNLSGCVHCLSPGSLLRKAEDDIDSGIVATLVTSCCRLRHLNLSAAHHHSADSLGKHLCQLLTHLKCLLSLALPVCSVADLSATTADKPSVQPASGIASQGFGKKVRIGVQSWPRNCLEQGNAKPTVFWTLLTSLPYLKKLELIGSSFSSAMPRNEPAIRNALPPCSRAQHVGDSEVAAIGQLAFLQSLTLAQLPNILTGSGLISIGARCQHLRTLSLANLGMMGKVAYMAALMDMLKHCKCLRDLRLEQPYFNANTQFFQALSHCSSLQRLCIISRRGTLQPDAVTAFMTACLEVVMLHMFTGESLTVCKSLQQSLIRRSPARRLLKITAAEVKRRKMYRKRPRHQHAEM
ncbi:F-box/LRR-repeat protein 18 isoform X2 [Paroedura picta]|uniref:F-box/LRR-repeat protein 18 isoform X2 n=1 Tax=Paroedura picta TaxID=143630 RepID=UPI0040567B9D